MTATPLLIGPIERAQLQRLRELAARHPVDMSALRQRLETCDGKRTHMRQMSKQTVYLPVNFAVTSFSIEIGHPIGTCRHMSMSVNRPDRVPSPEGMWMVAEELGFTGGLSSCTVWPEELQGHGKAINIVQPVVTTSFGAPGGTA